MFERENPKQFDLEERTSPRSQVALGNAPIPAVELPPTSPMIYATGSKRSFGGRAFPSATWERGTRAGSTIVNEEHFSLVTEAGLRHSFLVPKACPPWWVALGNAPIPAVELPPTSPMIYATGSKRSFGGRAFPSATWERGTRAGSAIVNEERFSLVTEAGLRHFESPPCAAATAFSSATSVTSSPAQP